MREKNLDMVSFFQTFDKDHSKVVTLCCPFLPARCYLHNLSVLGVQSIGVPLNTSSRAYGAGLVGPQSLDHNEVKDLITKGTGRAWGSGRLSRLISSVDTDEDGQIGEMEFLHNTVQWTPAMR